MAILKRINKYQGLKDIDVLKEESGLSSQYFNIYDVPTNIPQGRSSFLLAGSPYLKNFVELKVEILDSAGQTVYTEPVANYLEGNARRISVEVYDDTAPGDGFLYIVGELKDNFRSVSGQQQQNIEITDNFLTPEDRADFIEHSNDVPSEFQDVYNVRYIRPIFINTVIPNSEPIFFYQQPRITINEILKGYVVETTVSSSYEITGSVSVDPIQGLEPKDPDPDPIDGFSKGMMDGARDEVGAQLEIFKNRRKSKIDPLRNNKFAKSGRITRRASPEIDRFTITVDQLETSPENTTSDAVTSAFIGGEITIKSPKVDTTKYPTDEYTIPTEYKSSIKKVNNEKTLVPLDDFVITKKDTGEKVPVKIEQGGEGEPSDMEVTMSVVPTPPQVISTTHYRSYADIVVGNLHTFSGDVYKAKIYAKSKGTLGDFEPVYDASIESPQVLIDAFSATGFKNTGYFYTQSIVDNYWVTSSNSTATQDNSQFIDGVLISGSNAGYTPENSIVNTVEFNTSHSYNLEKSVPYTIEFNAYYYKEDKEDENGDVTKQAELEVYLSGSAITGGTEEDYKLGKVTVSDTENEGQVFGVHNTFTSAGSGSPNAHLKFKAASGRWIIQDILLRPHSETNFNPSYFRTVVPMEHPLPKKPDDYDFLVEFYDLNNNIAETISIRENVTFAGAPVNIDGEDNLLSGSLFIGNTQGSGFEMAGASSAYIRSLTYEGFDKTIASSSGGFMMWSGSVGGRLSSSEDYDGVGLEIVDAHGATDRYLQFKTNPSTFKVQTDEFFLGSTSQFVSGSNSNIEISSSNFHLTPEGDVTMSGTITATAGNIGDWTISGGDIVGANITMDADSSRIYKTDDNADLTGYYMDFTPGSNYYIRFGTNFAVSSSGTLIAEGAIIEGVLTSSEGLIANWTIDSDSIYKLTSGKYSGLSSTGDTRFFGGASSLTATGSAPFNVKATGDITGSSVLFTGGKVGGFEIVTDGLSSVNNAFQVTGSTGQITGSNVLFSGGKIGGWNINETNITSPGAGIRLNANGDNSEISINTHTFGNEGIQLGYNGGAPRLYAGDGAQNFLRYDTSNGVSIKTTLFELDTPSVEISTTHASMSLGTGQEIVIRGNSNSPFISIQPAEALVDKNYGGAGIIFAVAAGSTPLFSAVGSGGHIKFDGSDIDIKSDTFNLATPTVSMSSAGTGLLAMGPTPPTAYNSGNGVYFDGTGKFLVGSGSGDHLQFDGTNFDVQVGSLELDATNIEISSTNASMSLGEGKILLDGSNDLIRVGSNASNNVKVVGTATQGYIHTGKTSAASTTAGFWLANNAGDPEFHVGNSTDYLKFDGGNLNITSQNLEISSSTIQVSTTQASMSLGHDNSNPYGKIIIEGSGTPTFRVGPSAQNLSLTAGSGIYIDGDGNFKFGDSDGQVKFQDGSFSITGSDVAINVTDINISASGFELSSTQASMSLGTNKQWVAFGGNTSPYLSVGQSTVGYGNSGVFLGYVNSVTRPRVSFVGSTGHFKVDQDVDIKTETFELDANTGDLQISSAHKSMSLNDGTIILDGPNKKIKVGSTNAVTIQGGGNGGVDNYIVMGSKADFSDYDKSTQGIILGMDTAVPKFEMAKSSTNYLRWDTTSGLDLATEAMEVSASNIQISSAQASMSIGPSQTNPIVLQSLGNDRFLKFGGKTDFDQTGTAGFIMGIDNGTAKFDFTIGTGNNNYLRVDGSNVDIKTPNFKLDTTNLDIDSSTSRIQIFDGSAGERVRIGEISDAASDLYGFKIYDGSGTADGNTLVKLGEEGNRIAGWTINQTSLSSNNIFIHSAGSIETADFTSNEKGWRISADGNGTAEFENVRIRGTLSTAVFEKETVNAVGGQLYIANSTAITGSASMSISAATMSVVNSTGFTGSYSNNFGEIITAKKVSNTGFQTEYMLVRSASRDFPDSEDNFAGKLYVERAWGSGSSGEFVGDLASNSQSYEPGQVIVSTGLSGSGYIRLNANPSDTSTPYMDIVERTGSGIYDVEHKVRVGDLSGLSAGKLYGETNPGFGLYGENVFLSGSITATSGSIKGRMHITTSPSEEILLGTNVSGTDDGIYINNNNYWFTDATFKVGSANYYLQNDASGNITIHPKTFELDADTGELQISSTEHSMSFNDDDILIHAKDSGGSHIRVGRNVDRAITISGSQHHGAIYSGKTSVASTTAGFWLANNNTDPEFHLGSSTNFMKYDGGALSMTTQTFELDAGTGDLQLSSGNTSMSFADNSIKIGATSAGSGVGYLQVGQDITKAIQITGSNTVGSIRSVKDSFTDNTAGFWIANNNGTQEFYVGTATEHIKFDGSNMSLAGDNISLSATTVDVTTGTMKVDADDFQIDSTAPSMSLGYDTNANAGMTLIGGSPSLIGFGPKSGYNMELRSTTTDDHLKIGSRDFGSGTGIILGSDGGTYKLEMYRNASNYLTFSSAGDLSIRTDTFDLQGTNMALNNTRMYLGTIQSDSDTSGAGVYMDNGGAFRVQGNTTNYLRVDGGTMALATDDFSLDTAKGDIIFNSLVQRISMGASPPVDDFRANGIIISGSGYFNFQKDQYNYLRHDSNGLGLASQELNVSGSTTFRLHGKSGGSQLRLGASADSITSTANTGIFMDSGAVFRVGEATSGDNFIYFNGSNSLQIKSTNFDLTAGSAGSGELGVNTTRIALGDTLPTAYNSGTGFFVNKDGEFLLGAHGGDRIQYGGSGTLTIVSSNMDITANTFNLNAGSGKLLIDSSVPKLSMNHSDGKILLGSATTVDLGEGFYADGGGNFRIGDATSGGTDYLKFTASGNLVIKSSDIDISTSNLEVDATELYISTDNQRIALGADGSAVTYDSSGIFLGEDGSGVYKFSLKSSSGDSLTWNGAGQLDITGNVTADSGNIGGWSITNNAIYTGTEDHSGYTANDGDMTFYSDGSDSSIHAKNFYVTNEGDLVARDVNLTGTITATDGLIGGWDIVSNTLESVNSRVILDSTSDGKIRLGSTPPTSATSGTGIFLGGDGTFLAGSSSGNRIQFTSGGAIVLQSNTFALNTSTMILDSSVNSGKISLGASGGPTSVSEATTRKGIYMDGTGDILIKASSGSGEHFMKFTDAGLELKTANLTFDTSGNITSQEYLIERSRLFGSGVDETIVLSDNTNGGSTFQDSTYGVDNVNGTRILLNGPERASQGATYGTTSANWHQLGDIYCETFTINTGVTLWTNGYRIFVRGTLDIKSGATIRNTGFNGANGAPISTVRPAAGKGAGNGTGSPAGTLAKGTDGSMGGAGGTGGSQHGSSGGAGGGSGGTVLIFARNLTGTGTILVQGGNGGIGGTSEGDIN